MTNDELNTYIKHYIEKDKTGRAVMLTGAWGVGKSFYIKNCLIPFLAKTENGAHQCIVVSLYGLSNLSEISKAVYLEARVKILRPESEAGQITLLAAKTILKGLTSYLGLDLSSSDKSLQDLFRAVDLSGKLIIFEDVERTNINILDLLGYVNSLVEQDNVKVLLVTNEKEIIHFEPVEKTKKDDSSNWLTESKQDEEKVYTKETLQYLETKEKTIGDTILFTGDVKPAVEAIVTSFENKLLLQLEVEKCAEDVADIMYLMRSENLRSVIYACQKTADIFDAIPDPESFSEDFLRSIFYGTVAFSIRLHSGLQAQWVGLEHYSLELGIGNYPLFRFCFDYILTQHLDTKLMPLAEASLKKLRLYDKNKTTDDPDLQTLTHYHIHTEIQVKESVSNITRRLEAPEDISFYDYGRIAVALIGVKHALGMDIDAVAALLVRNLKGRGDKIHEDDLFWYTLSGNSKEEQEDYIQLRDAMLHSLNEEKSIIPDFSYLPEQASALYDYAVKNSGYIYETHGFARFLDIPRLAEMFFCCTPAQMDRVRCTFVSLYRPENIKSFLADDCYSLQQLHEALEEGQKKTDIDKVQHMQCQWFISCLQDSIKKLT